MFSTGGYFPMYLPLHHWCCTSSTGTGVNDIMCFYGHHLVLYIEYCYPCKWYYMYFWSSLVFYIAWQYLLHFTDSHCPFFAEIFTWFIHTRNLFFFSLFCKIATRKPICHFIIFCCFVGSVIAHFSIANKTFHFVQQTPQTQVNLPHRTT